ncbi:hypothetical protein ABPG72_019011 [Tetrahymena utriculariae]
MKVTFMILLLLSLASFFAIGSMSKSQHFKTIQVRCLNTILNLETKEVTATNGCDQSLTFKFSIISKNQDQQKEIEFQSICVKDHETQAFAKLDLPNYGSFTIVDKEEIQC